MNDEEIVSEKNVPAAKPKPRARGMEMEMINLYHNVSSLFPNQPCISIQFLDCHSGKASSALLREFAKAAANRLGKKVLLFDADSYHQTHGPHFRIPNFHGWDDVIHEEASLEDVLFQVEQTSLYVCAGSSIQEGTQVQGYDSRRVKEVFEELKCTFELILMDTPPLFESADGLTVSRLVDGVVVVVEAEVTRREAALQIVRRIEAAGGTIAGTILNKRRFYIPKFVYKWI